MKFEIRYGRPFGHRRPLSLVERFRLALAVLIKESGRFHDSRCRIEKGVGPIQDAAGGVERAAQDVYDSAVDTLTSTKLPP